MVSRGDRVAVSATHTTRCGARGRGGRHTVALRRHYYSTTSNWVKLLSVSESPLPELYATAAFQVQQLLMVCEDSTPWCGLWCVDAARTHALVGQVVFDR